MCRVHRTSLAWHALAFLSAIDCLIMTLGRIEHRLNRFEQRNDTALEIPDLVRRNHESERSLVARRMA